MHKKAGMQSKTVEGLPSVDPGRHHLVEPDTIGEMVTRRGKRGNAAASGSGAQPVTARLAAAGAMLPELYALAEALPGEPDAEVLRRLVVDENVLTRPSQAARVKLYEKLQQRYFPPNRPDDWRLLINALRRTPLDDQRNLVACVALNWNDLLFRALNTTWLFPRIDPTGLAVEVEDILEAIQKLEITHRAVRHWRESTRYSVARHYLGALRDLGFARGKAKKHLACPYLGPEVLLFACELLVAHDIAAPAIVRHEIFRALGLTLDETVEALHDLDRRGLLRFRTQGGVVHLELNSAEKRP